MLEIKQKQIRRHRRIRKRISGTALRPRLCVFFSNSHVYAQLVDDQKAATLAFVSDIGLKSKPSAKSSEKQEGEKLSGKAKIAFEVGRLIAKAGLEKKVENVVFDRGGFKYHGVVKALADGAREGGLKF